MELGVEKVSDTRTAAGRGVTTARVTAPEAAWHAFRRAATTSPQYGDLLNTAGVDPGTERDWDAVPVIDRRLVFGGETDGWMAAGGITAASEVVCSSGQSGPPFALGLVGPGGAARMAERVDDLLTGIGAGPASPTLLVNALPMGIAIPTTIATAAAPSVHIEMALHLLTGVAPAFDRVVIAGEPLFLAELARRWRDSGATRPETWLFTGGEPVAESWRGYVCGLLDLEIYQVSISMGAAELGLHLLFELPELAVARAAAAADPAGSAEGTWGEMCDRAYAPSLFAYDPERFHIESRWDASGSPRLVVTMLEEGPLPLVRYDLGDVGMVLDERRVAALSAFAGVPLSGPVVAVAGRSAYVETAAGARVRPEAVKERLFADVELATDLTGRFRLEVDAGGDRLACHLEARGRGAPAAGVEQALVDLERWLWRRGGVGTRVVRHPRGAYPYHPEGDWTHKPRYVGLPGGAA